MLPSTFLIIDPNLHFSRAAANYLSKFPEVSNVDLAADADEAFLMIGAGKPDALLVDYNYYISDARVKIICEKMKEHSTETLIIALTLYTLEFDCDLLPIADFISGIISKQGFVEGVITLFDLPLTT